jgi:hypothetical protein
VPIYQGYVRPLYLEPLYQRRIAFGRDGFPFTYRGYTGNVSYEPGICPVTERMHFEELIYTNICHADIARADLDDFVAAFDKVLTHAAELRADANPSALVAAS